MEEQQPDKVAKEFSISVNKLTAILGSPSYLNPSSKIPQDELSTIVGDLLKDEKEKNRKEISDQLRALLKGYAELKAEIAKKEKELKQLEQTKMGEFNKAAKQLFSRIEEIDKIEQEYYGALKETVNQN